jgi:Zn-dependent M16 (insulinase) family peptidase
MDIYLDAVFHPNIYIHDEIFRQEGWHYEMEDPDASLVYNGVVYNEMKGAFSAVDDVISRKISNSLFPDTIYGVESGGDPDVIPELTYENYLAFHQKYYHPSNSYIYLYGDMDVEERLRYLDEAYLSDYDYLYVDSEIPLQETFQTPVYQEDVYPVGQEESADNASYLTMNWVMGAGTDPVLYQAINILEYILLETPGAPVKQALLDAQCGEDIYGYFETELQQPYFSLIVKKMDPKLSGVDSPQYLVETWRGRDIPAFEPYLPAKGRYIPSESMREYVLSTLINGQISAYGGAEMKPKMAQAREVCIRNMLPDKK